MQITFPLKRFEENNFHNFHQVSTAGDWQHFSYGGGLSLWKEIKHLIDCVKTPKIETKYFV